MGAFKPSLSVNIFWGIMPSQGFVPCYLPCQRVIYQANNATGQRTNQGFGGFCANNSTNMERELLSTQRKALKINLDDTVYGSFAEIGGGQEVARNFFQAGGASGTVARTISAYDMAFSNALYGLSPSGRYVSKERLLQMLDHEFPSLVDLLREKRHPQTRFFAFANTVATLNFRKDNESHGWMGIRFQLKPASSYNEVVVHIRLLEMDTLAQQQTLGVFGVNLLYACLYHSDWPNEFLRSLMDNLSPDRVEVNLVEMKGPELDYIDNRLLSVQLVKHGMTQATMFDRYGRVQQPADMLYKKNILVLRGSFRPITYVGFDMLRRSYSMFKRDEDHRKDSTFTFCEITLNNLLGDGDLDERDFLDRVDILNAMGQNVMITNFREFYRLAVHLNQYKIKNLRLIIGAKTLEKVLDKAWYHQLGGGILEACGALFSENTKLYLYPSLDKQTGQVITSANVRFSPDLFHLYQHLLLNRKILDIREYKSEWLHIDPQEVLRLMCEGNEQWKTMVPAFISKQINARSLFWCRL
jgi:hypothetical protein